MMSSDPKNIDYTKVKIKQERPSPPRRRQQDEIVNDIIPKLFATANDNVAANEVQDEKKSVEPVKSSNEILAELFRVFNATPPESLMNDNFLLEKQKKLNKEKKHKKSKKDDVSCGDDSSDDEKRKKKKKKKHKRHKKEKSDQIQAKVKVEKDGSEATDEVRLKSSRSERQSTNDLKTSDLSEFTISSEEESSVPAPKVPIVIKKEKEPSPKPSHKIIIKSLKNSKVLANAQRQSRFRAAGAGKANDGACSEISLSDEETYLREKEERSGSRQRGYSDRRDDGRRTRFSRDNYKDRSRDRSRRQWRGSRSRSRSRSRYWRRSRSRSRSRRPSDLMIDKKRLLEIARKNAISMFKNGSLPGTQSMPQDLKNKVLMKMRYGGKTVEELTDFCKKLSKGENFNDLSSLSSNDDSDYDKHGNDKAFHHPFMLKDRGPIVMNIKNATPIPPKTADQSKSALQFPVSSGQQHRLNESEWVPVIATKTVRVEPVAPAAAPKPAMPKNVFEKPLPVESQQQPAFTPTTLPPNNTQESDKITTAAPIVVPPPIPIPLPPPLQQPPQIESIADVPLPPPAPSGIFPQVDVTSVITQRLNAMRKLQENPTDSEAMQAISRAQKNIANWVTSFSPGLFTGSTGANILTPRELTAGQQAWVKRDQLITTTPVSGGMGMHLLQKMGWKPGEGLGKTKNGCLQPLLLEVKMDKRGLVTKEEHHVPNSIPPKRRKVPAPTPAQAQQNLESKHPVSLLGELSGKRKWGPPLYELVNEEGPSHRRNFTFKVVVNGMMYQPSIPCKTKKDAKALAAKYCLQQLGIIPTG